ncbi:RHS repeat-associated core domain-containing protein [bacterium]|nr:RHS repeat-associated core domain-containing protein [bacterium]
MIKGRSEIIYDKVGNRKQLTESDAVSGTHGKKTEYIYDELYRLTKVVHKERNDSYALYEYDPSGNRTFMHQDQGDFEYKMESDGAKPISNKLKEIISNGIGHTYLDYDDNGNLIGEKEYKGTETEGIENYNKDFIWDYENRLMSVSIDRDDKIFTVYFAYNGDGQRIYKQVIAPDETIESKILYIRNSFGEVVEEHSLDLASNIYHLISSYVFGNGKRIMGITVKEGETPGTTVEEKTYYLSDILGSNSLLTDEFGEATMLTKYDEFGNTYYEWSLTSNINHQASSYKYTGKPFDSEIGLYYYGARYYNLEWGRWVSKDRMKGIKNIVQSINAYQYCYNNPLVLKDPDGNFVGGLQWQFSIMAGIGGGSFTTGVVTDFEGNYGIMITGGAGLGGGFGASIGLLGLFISNVATIQDLEGTGIAYGGSVKLWGGLGIETGQLTDFQYSDETDDWTFEINAVKGIGIEAHAFITCTAIIPLQKSMAKKVNKMIQEKALKGEAINPNDFKDILGEEKYNELLKTVEFINSTLTDKKEKIKKEEEKKGKKDEGKTNN